MKNYTVNLILAFVFTIVLALLDTLFQFDVKSWVIMLFFPMFIIILNQFDLINYLTGKK